MYIKHFILIISNVSEKHSSEGQLHTNGSQWGRGKGSGVTTLFLPPSLDQCCLLCLKQKRKDQTEFSTSELGREGGILHLHPAEAQHRACEDSLQTELDCLFLTLQIKEEHSV